MSGEKRREKILEILKTSDQVVSGEKLSKLLNVSRQVIVQDITLLRAVNHEILSTTRGYYLNQNKGLYRILKVHHSEAEMIDEMNLIVDLGGTIEDVFVYHKIYGVIKAKMGIKSRRDVKNYLEDIKNGTSQPLMQLTSGYHYHTISADTIEELDLIQQEMADHGFLAELKDYEPVDFWGESSKEPVADKV